MSARGQERKGAPLPPRAGLIALMLIGALALWVGDPVLWLWITSRLQSTQASMGPYALMLVGITLTAVVLGKGLAPLNRLYSRVTGIAPPVKIVVPLWRSNRGAPHRRGGAVIGPRS